MSRVDLASKALPFAEPAAGSSGLHRVALTDVPRQPWRNGGGLTRELLTWPQPAPGAEPASAPSAWRLRVSVAEVHRGGPFSAFAGVERHFALLDGPAVTLQWPGHTSHPDTIRLDAHSPACRFDGGDPPVAGLEGHGTPSLDLNLMLARPATRASASADAPVNAPLGGLQPATPGVPWAPPTGTVWRGLLTRRAVRVLLPEYAAAPLDLPAWTLLWSERTDTAWTLLTVAEAEAPAAPTPPPAVAAAAVAATASASAPAPSAAVALPPAPTGPAGWWLHATA